jgi:hypothetical protein
VFIDNAGHVVAPGSAKSLLNRGALPPCYMAGYAEALLSFYLSTYAQLLLEYLIPSE